MGHELKDGTNRVALKQQCKMTTGVLYHALLCFYNFVLAAVIYDK